MAEYIEREALMRKIKEINCAECDSYNGVRCRACWVDDTLDYIDSEQAADVAPVRHGQWEARAIPRSDPDGDWIALEYHCSLCNRLEYRKENYCPNCGAKMLDLEG